MSTTKIELPAVFKIDSTDEVYASMQSRLAESGDIQIDGEQVTAVDFAGLQLLMAFAKHCGKHERKYVLGSPSETLLGAIDSVGARTHLGVT
ncbi:MAG: STAS domain-containing protein [Gammaproteobacteria bacterium]